MSEASLSTGRQRFGTLKNARASNAFKYSPGRNYIRPPPLPPFLAKRHFPVEGGGGVYFEAPRGRNFIRPPPPPFIHPPPLGGYFQGWGGVGVYNIRMPLNIRMQWNVGTACVSECLLKTLACRGLRVGPSKCPIHRSLPGPGGVDFWKT